MTKSHLTNHGADCGHLTKSADNLRTVNSCSNAIQAWETGDFSGFYNPALGQPFEDKTKAADYGEPWECATNDPGARLILDRCGRLVLIKGKATIVEQLDRARSCVNACAGMADPAAEIQAMRDELAAIKSDFFDLCTALNAHDAREGVMTAKAMRAAIKDAVPFLDNFDDAGPTGEAWQSPELQAVIANLNQFIQEK